ncbi:sigma factor-like helix-turn-helix DNA-binding protein [Streptomyces ipomoeae]|uniref:sigma factor-like helix-turn-helix DNA-binding protein n=1 Tax=Streptomyces ipomoeae TaxID=103232 RepID=UPI0015F01D8E|nr:sigma factor-like helix-turn-helix DNA-binding protein [Streptomyces ipomoeae]
MRGSLHGGVQRSSRQESSRESAHESAPDEQPTRTKPERHQRPTCAGTDTTALGDSDPVSDPAPAPAPDDPALTPAPLTPAQAFDALYACCAPSLVQQTYLLTGRRCLARDAVEQAFQLAWQRWPEVAVDRDPAGWVRAAAHEYALSPWHRLRHRLLRQFRHPEPPPADPTGRALLDALLKLPPPYRRTLILYDGLRMDLPETAAETEASTAAAAGRLMHAREAVAGCLPEPISPDTLHRLLTELPAGVHPGPAEPIVLRAQADLRARRWIHTAIAFTTILLTTTALTLHIAPDHYEPPIPPGTPVQGLPPKPAAGPLSPTQQALRAKLRSATATGPERLRPEAH